MKCASLVEMLERAEGLSCKFAYDLAQNDAADLEACRKAVELNLNHAGAHNNLGNALYKQGKFDDAVLSYRKAIKLDPKLAAAHNNLGVTLRKQGKFDDAVLSYRKAIKLDPKDAFAHYNLGLVLKKQDKRDEAIKHFQTATNLGDKAAEERLEELRKEGAK